MNYLIEAIKNKNSKIALSLIETNLNYINDIDEFNNTILIYAC